MFSEVRRPLITVAVCSATLLAGALPAVAAPAEPNVHVVSTRFDKLTYQAGDAATVTYKFANSGSVDAVKVVNGSGGNGDPWELEITDWAGVGYDQEGITIPAGQTVSVVLRGIVPGGAANVGRVTIAYGFTAQNGDTDPGDNVGVARASVPGLTGESVGSSYYDKNANHRNDPGEGVEGVEVTLIGLYDIDRRATTHTDRNGDFRFTGLPVGEYEIRVTPPTGWWLTYGGNVGSTEVRADEHPDLVYEVEPQP
ncbi:SdrD B-like domain-containing protein [Amycolatopsis mongoliensis]|uniref:SdrD B-like domain-containing protein n=1 Tax=Amycolatopsis mongoliensis TaxID=715475 RepID=A0A9Y2K1R0_9PSEU|nr:SdrD B-like domain-containing protein [Amycolatopsis sp. 4-36]WIY07507.1 SdrD B-like domain-containing protein [Amycolatopsis sp. 4-36]